MKFAVILVLAFAAAAQPPKGDNCTPPPSSLAPTLPARILPGMGTVHLAITTSNPEAQQFFDQGVAQMHSFWAREAERSFLQAAALDPAAPMPQWGIAMVAAGDWRPRFQIETNGAFFGKTPAPATSRARIAAKKAVELSRVPGKATDLERCTSPPSRRGAIPMPKIPRRPSSKECVLSWRLTRAKWRRNLTWP